MPQITLRRHILHFYIGLILGTVLLVGLGGLLTFAFVKESSTGILNFKDYMMPVFGIALIVMACYTIFKYYKNVPKISIDNNFISFNSESFPLLDIQKVILTGKHNFPYILSIPMEAASIKFKDGNIRFIYDDMYENSWELKNYLKYVVIQKKQYTSIEALTIDPSELNEATYDEFSNNQFISLRGIALWGMMGLFLFLLVTAQKLPGFWVLIFISSFGLLWLSFHAWLMHYFQISGRLLVVRNHILPWKKKGYRLSELQEIVFETRAQMPNCLRVITKDFRQKLYPAGTLHDRTWLQLKARLESSGITVRNECI